MNNLRIFISSPGDVPEERARARQVVQGLNRRYARHFNLVPVFWEDMPLGLDASFQEGIDVLISKDSGVDIAVFILWSRLGSALGARFARADGREYRSGTERELDLMLEARAAQAGRRPHILAYARQDEATFEEQLRGKSTDEKEQLLKQKKLVERFIREEFHDETTGTNLRAYHTYHRPQSFSERLRVHLQEIVDGLSSGRSSRPAWEIDQRGPPFVGLASFRYEHAEVFFGREDEVSEARLRLAAAARRGTPFLLVSGASGSGKSSLAAAGLLPEITAYETDETVSRWLHATCTPVALGGDPAAGMGRVLAQALPKVAADGAAEDLVDGLREGPVVTVKLAVLPALKAEASTTGGVRLVLLVDQLEELFTDPRLTDGARDQFARILAALCSTGQVWVIATIRGDFYHRLLDCPEFVRLVTEGGQFPLAPPGIDALRRTIESPALLAGLSYEQTGETTLADRILRDVSGQAELLPLLEDLLRELFERRSTEGVLTHAAYESLGGIEGALARRGEESLARLPTDVQMAFPDVIRRLVATSDSSEGAAVRRRVPLQLFPAGSPARVLVDALVADRLLTASAGEDGTPEVSIAHETLLRVWPRAANWIRENGEFLRLRDRLAARMREGAPLSADDPLVPAARAALDYQPDAFESELAAYAVGQLAAIDRERTRQVLRRRMLFAAAAASLVAVTLGGLALQARADRQRLAAEAAGAVFALERAGTGQIATAAAAATRPELAAFARPRLEEAFSGTDAAAEPAKKLRAALGLVRLPSVNDDVWTYLAESLLVAEPGELAEIREALAPQQARFGELFWSRARGEERGERLRAAAALAAYDPRGEGWPAIAPAVAGDLVNVPAVHLGDWLAALSPVRRGLVPALMAIFADPARRDVERSLAIDILADYAADDPAVLGELTMTAEPEQFPAVSRQVEARFAAVAPLLEAEIARSLPEELPAADPARETLGIRQAKAAAVLLRFGRPECVWPLFVHSPDPRVRSYLIHFLGPFAVSPEPLAERLAVEPDVSARRALILALGEMVGAGAASEVREADSDRVCARLLPLLRDIFSREPDPGLHAAAEWTLRELGDAKWLTARREAWRDEQGDAASPRLDAVLREFSGGGPREPRWFVNSQGQSFVAIPGPVEFLMGSPESELGHRADEIHHRRRIARSFAITSKPITKEQVNRLVGYGPWGKALPYIGSDSASPPDVPRPGQSWLSAAIYCNALSDAEGLPESEWVYEWEREGALHSIRPAQNWRDRSGYRLPTESEWEYATRAGGGTSRFYGETTGLLGKYAWYSKNSGLDALEGHRVARPVGHKKPNDFGIYDALGNVWNWCQDPHAPYPQGARDSAIEDEDVIPVFSRNKSHVLRGGSYENPSRSLRSASRSLAPIQAGGLDYGFRVARTLLPVPMTALPNTGGSGEDVPTPSDLD